MAEAALAEAPPNAAASEPSAAPDSADQSDGPSLADLVSSFNKGPEADAAPDKPDAPDAAPKPDESDEAPKPDKPTADGKSKPSPKLYEAHKALQRRVATEYEPKLAQLQKEVEELRARKPEAPEMKEFQTVKQRNEELARKLAETDYAQGADYKRDFLDAREALLNEAKQGMAQLAVRYSDGVDDEGKPIIRERRAVAGDFERILELPAWQQDRAIQDWFGAHAYRVQQYISELNRNTREGKLAVERHGTERNVKMREASEKAFAEEQKYNQALAENRQELESKWPHWFKVPPADGDTGDKELAKAHQEGVDFVRSLIEEGPTMASGLKARKAALMVARAESWPRVVLESKRKDARIAELEAKVKARDGSDPGSGGSPTAGGGEPSSEPDDIDTLASKFNRRP